MSSSPPWKFVPNQKKHTQDGVQLVSLMKSVGRGLRSVVAVDVGCGDGIITQQLFEQRRVTKAVAIDILPEAVKTAEINLRVLTQQGKVSVKRCSASSYFRDRHHWDAFDRFIINPPFFARGSGRANKSLFDQKARHEGSLTLKVWAWGAGKLLRTGGELYCVFPTERLSELCAELSKRSVEPKEIWWMSADKRKRRVFMRAVRGAKPGLTVHTEC